MSGNRRTAPVAYPKWQRPLRGEGIHECRGRTSEMGGYNMNRRNKVVRLGMDIGKNPFHLIGVDETGLLAVRKKRRRK